MQARVLLIRTAGTNCDRELAFAFERAGARVEEEHLLALRERPQRIREVDLVALPGGFTYGDDLGAGRILALELRRYLGDALGEHHERGGSLFGVCNGFQALVRAGLLPDLEGIHATLTWNRNHRFECRWVRLRVEAGLGHVLPAGSLLPAPVAHAEGRLVFRERGAPARLEEEGRIAFRYVDARGEPVEDWPACPNGSTAAIAGLVSASGRIVGLMPHPERNLSPAHLPDSRPGRWGDGTEGLAFFRGLLQPYGAGSPA